MYLKRGIKDDDVYHWNSFIYPMENKSFLQHATSSLYIIFFLLLSALLLQIAKFGRFECFDLTLIALPRPQIFTTA